MFRIKLIKLKIRPKYKIVEVFKIFEENTYLKITNSFGPEDNIPWIGVVKYNSHLKIKYLEVLYKDGYLTPEPHAYYEGESSPNFYYEFIHESEVEQINEKVRKICQKF